MRIYVGPYVVVRYREEFDVDHFRACVNDVCDRNRKQQWSVCVEKFCGQCGMPTDLVPKNVPRRPRVADVVGYGSGLHEAFGDESRRVVVAASVYGPRAFDSSYVDEVDLTDVDRGAEVKWFEETFAEQLCKLRAAYDASVRWGVVERED